MLNFCRRQDIFRETCFSVFYLYTSFSSQFSSDFSLKSFWKICFKKGTIESFHLVFPSRTPRALRAQVAADSEAVARGATGLENLGNTSAPPFAVRRSINSIFGRKNRLR